MTEKMQKIKKNIPTISVLAAFIVAMTVIFCIPQGKKEETKQFDLSEYSSVSEICELATLRTYYHNVAIYQEKAEGPGKIISDIFTWPFNELLNIGNKQIWLEYSGTVDFGIDQKEQRVQIDNPDRDGVVIVYVPDAKVLNVDAESFSETLDEKGAFTTITAKERSAAYAAAQNNMRSEAENDQSLLRRAKNNAKILLEKYIINLGKAMGVDYTVRFVDNPW